MARHKFRQNKTAEEYLNSKLDKSGDCWIWTGCLSVSGYGICSGNLGAKALRINTAHRLAYSVWVGHFPTVLHVLHTCDNRACCNPDHLWLGTHVDNMEDMKNKKRYWAPYGRRKSQEYYNSILQYRGKLSSRKVAKIVNLSKTRVQKIWNTMGC